MRRWNIGIISTDYDLKDERRMISTFLDKYPEINVLAFERPDYPVDPYVHSHDACLNVIDLMDIAFVIINKRYGGLYIGDNNVSITYAEIEKLYKNKKIIIPIINQKAWDERHEFFSAFKRSSEDDISKFGLSYSFNYVDCYRVLELIEKIHKSAHDNFCIFYSSIFELEAKVEGRLRGLTRYFCLSIMHKQADELRKKKTFLSLNQSLGDMFDKNLYVSPDVTALVGRAPKKRLEGALVNDFVHGGKTIILGEPGAGKSTLMIKVYLDCIQNGQQQFGVIPIYISLKDKKKEDSFCITDFYRESFETYLDRPLFPFCDFSLISFWAFLDGLDEMGENFEPYEISRLADTELMKYVVLLSCREKYAYNYFQSTVLGSKFNQIFLLKKWSPTKAKKYIRKYAKGIPLEKRNNILCLVDLPEIINTFNNPLITNLILFSICEGNMTVPPSFRDQADSLNYAVHVIAKRGVERNDYHLSIVEYLDIWMNISWVIYKSRENNSSVYISDVVNFIVEKYPSMGDTEALNVIMSIFDTNVVRKTITGCIHEQIMEYLAASFLLEAILTKTDPYPAFLAHVIRPEINHLLVAKYNSISKKDKNEIFESLYRYYQSILFSDSEKNIMTRIRIVYYLTRMQNENRSSFIDFTEKGERNDLVRISVFSGCVKHGNLKLENAFYKELTENPDFESLYMGYHLVYYKDVTDKEIPFPYYDNTVFGWSKTFLALYKQFTDPHREYFYMMRIELYVISRFVETRQSTGIISLHDLKNIEKIVQEYSNTREKEFYRFILEAYQSVKEMYERYHV